MSSKSYHDNDVIELGEDGSFDVSLSHSVKQIAVPAVDYANFDWQLHERETETINLLQALEPHEYAIYHQENRYLVLVRLKDNEEVAGVRYGSQELVLKLILKQQEPDQSEQFMKIALPSKLKIEEDSVMSKHFQSFVTIQFQAR